MSAISKFIMKGGTVRLTRNIYVSVFSFLALAFFIMGQGLSYSAVFISAILIHELSHIFFLYLFKAPIKSVTVFPFGIDIQANTLCLSYKKELICTLAGSFANFCAAAIGIFVFAVSRQPTTLFFVLCNFFLGAMNLIPLSFFDGGKAARLIIYDIFEIDKAYGICKGFETFSGMFFLIISFLVMKNSLFNLSVILLVVYASVSSLFRNVTKSTENS